MQQQQEDSFVSGMKQASGATLGLLVVLFFLFIVAPCTFCGGMTVLGSIVGEDVETQKQYQEY